MGKELDLFGHEIIYIKGKAQRHQIYENSITGEFYIYLSGIYRKVIKSKRGWNLEKKKAPIRVGA